MPRSMTCQPIGVPDWRILHEPRGFFDGTDQPLAAHLADGWNCGRAGRGCRVLHGSRTTSAFLSLRLSLLDRNGAGLLGDSSDPSRGGRKVGHVDPPLL